MQGSSTRNRENLPYAVNCKFLLVGVILLPVPRKPRAQGFVTGFRNMEPFRTAAPLAGLIEPYLDAKVLRDAAKLGGESARTAFARLWLSEGIPFAFRECPGLYESVRSWVSLRLDVHAKEIGLAGSARLGSSLAPSKLCKPYDTSSDFDFFIVSGSLFEKVKEEFVNWSLDFESGRISPQNSRESGFWQDNFRRGPQLILRGFLDQKMVPNLPPYTTTKRISEAMWLLVEKLKLTKGAPAPCKASIRCYSTWDSFIRQNVLSLS